MDRTNLSPDEMRKRGYSSEAIAEAELIDTARKEALLLIPLIKKAFVDIPRPKITLSVARGYDNEHVLSKERILELSSKDPEQSWHEIDQEATEYFQEYFTFSDAEGWLFY